ncbi:protein takeout [Aedes aegypti]|uniref:Hemolymph juvenile hormone binding protein n=1 Tax=Aedes aegypti TaxID=7159 RepID=A0A6I8U417_AEDAE|nr:protein takeout [Aedes aegypti]
MKQAVILFLVVLGCHNGKPYVAPVLSVCSRSDPNLEKCIMNVVDGIRQNVIDANYGDGRQAPKFDPIYFDRMEINNGAGFRLVLSNVTIRGTGGFVIKKIRSDLAAKKFDIISIIPKMSIVGQYDLSMNILLLRAAGKGDFRLQLNDTIASLKVQYRLAPEGDKNFVRFDPIDLKLKFPKAKFYFTGLFNGDPALEEFGNQAINDNPNLILDEVKPSFEKNLGRVFTDISNSVVEGAEEFELLPP